MPYSIMNQKHLHSSNSPLLQPTDAPEQTYPKLTPTDRAYHFKAFAFNYSNQPTAVMASVYFKSRTTKRLSCSTPGTSSTRVDLLTI